ncbi:hypothetical protein D1007_35468 [Hordeum vulgare]|nr:hypothetical protein D1007_35468 [Hordeum vulgare]
MENHFGSNLISRKYEVVHALQYFTQSAAMWWKMHHAIQGFSGAETWDEFKKTLLRSYLIQKCYDSPKEKTCACKIYGEIGHNQEEHKDGCTHCEENHLVEECPSSQVTCFLCEGTTHYPPQCHIYPKVEQVVQQQKEAMKETLKKKILEEPVMNENIEDPDGQGLTRFFSNACYSCGEEGHYSQDCTKGRKEYLGNFPTEKVEFDPLQIEELAKIKESGKKKKYPLKSQISVDIDLSHVRCCAWNLATTNICAQEGSRKSKEQKQTLRSLETCQNSFAFVARKKDIMLVIVHKMTTLYDSFLKGLETIMTLTSDHDYPKILKDMMKHIHLEGDAVYKGYPVMESGVELWYVEVHLHHVKGVFPKTMGQYFFISRVPRETFFDALREDAMEAIRQIGEILEARLRHTQEYLSEVRAEMMEMKLMTTMMKQKMDDFKGN